MAFTVLDPDADGHLVFFAVTGETADQIIYFLYEGEGQGFPEIVGILFLNSKYKSSAVQIGFVLPGGLDPLLEDRKAVFGGNFSGTHHVAEIGPEILRIKG